MNSSDRAQPPARFLNVPSPRAEGATAPLSRFIPAEELGEVSPWALQPIGGAKKALPLKKPEPVADKPSPRQLLESKFQEVRNEAYQQGYEDGLQALESFKKSHSEQLSQRLGQLLTSFDQQLQALEADMADAVTRTAVQLAAQVLRRELRAVPESVADVAREALQQLGTAAKEVTVCVHPDDLAFTEAGAGVQLKARGAQLKADARLMRGGCRIESELGSIDAQLDKRWQAALQSLGQDPTVTPLEEPTP